MKLKMGYYVIIFDDKDRASGPFLCDTCVNFAPLNSPILSLPKIEYTFYYTYERGPHTDWRCKVMKGDLYNFTLHTCGGYIKNKKIYQKL